VTVHRRIVNQTQGPTRACNWNTIRRKSSLITQILQEQKGALCSLINLSITIRIC
jgi:hypothetical protein